MKSSRPVQTAGIIAQQIREIAPGGKDSARAPSQRSAPFLPDLCGVTGVAALVLIGELLALVLVLVTDGLNPFNWQRLGLVSLTVQWALLPSAAILCRLRPLLARLAHTTSALLSFAVVLAVLTAVLGVEHWWLADMSGGAIDYWSLLADLLVGAICAGVVLRYAYLQQQLHNQQQAELGARIEALQSRIRPHFLFNSMNSLASLIAVDPVRAEKLVEDLSALFRASLADSKLVPLAQEVALARRYLEIEALRLGARLQQEWQIDDLPEQAELPSMLLQPLLENAVLHGIARRRDGGTIKITLRKNVIGSRGSELLLSIENPIAVSGTQNGRAEMEPNPHIGNGMATENIRQRLGAFYGNRYHFHAHVQNGHYLVELRLPLKTGQSLKPAQKPTSKMEAAL